MSLVDFNQMGEKQVHAMLCFVASSMRSKIYQ